MAQEAGISPETVKRLEGLDGIISAYDCTLSAIQAAIEAAGVELTAGGGAGVRLKKR